MELNLLRQNLKVDLKRKIIQKNIILKLIIKLYCQIQIFLLNKYLENIELMIKLIANNQNRLIHWIHKQITN
jgi:hypothetical protein